MNCVPPEDVPAAGKLEDFGKESPGCRFVLCGSCSSCTIAEEGENSGKQLSERATGSPARCFPWKGLFRVSMRSSCLLSNRWADLCPDVLVNLSDLF